MKKISIILVSILISGFLFAQNEVDALRYSQTFTKGTARFTSMGGAFGALGGTFSAISINPAGIGVYRKSEFSLTPGFSYNVSNSKLGDNSFEDFGYDFNFNNIGIVGTFNTGAKSGWISTNIGFGYNRLNTFDMNVGIKRNESPNSIVDQWVNDANNGWASTGSSLAGKADLIYQKTATDPWMSDFEGSDYGQRQSISITSSGSLGEYIFSGGANYNNMVYLGGSFSINTVNYKEKKIHKEIDEIDNIEYLNSFAYTKTFETKGAGYNFKFGAIIKPAQWVRFGGAIHFPTFYKLHDDYSDHLDASLTFDNGPAVSEAGEFDYELTTPFKAIGSAAVVVGKVAIFSFDYEYLDYTKARFRNGGEFELENGRIQDVYTAAHNLRGGMEMRFGPISLRGGYSYFGSPFQSGEINEDADYSILSGGIGINSNSFYIDFAYSQMLNSENYVLYFAQQPAISNIDYGRNQVMATIGFRF